MRGCLCSLSSSGSSSGSSVSSVSSRSTIAASVVASKAPRLDASSASASAKPGSKRASTTLTLSTPLSRTPLSRPCVMASAAAPAAAAATRVSVSGRMNELKAKGRGAFIPFIMAGDPDLATTERALRALAAAGADAIELGVPYSDPLADGPTIQGAHTRGLASGTSLDGVLACVARVSGDIPGVPIVMFTYYNPIMRRGAAEFCLAAAAAGASGLLVPDIPLEETPPIRAAAAAAGLELVLLVTPTTPAGRMEAIARASQGFVYLVSVAGVTGTRTANEGRLQDLIKAAREAARKGGNESSESASGPSGGAGVDKPVAVGFGVSGPEQAKQIMQWGADGVIVGSALVRALGEAESSEEGLKNMEKLAREIRAAIP